MRPRIRLVVPVARAPGEIKSGASSGDAGDAHSHLPASGDYANHGGVRIVVACAEFSPCCRTELHIGVVGDGPTVACGNLCLAVVLRDRQRCKSF